MADSSPDSPAWDKITTILRRSVPRQQFETWFSKIQPLCLNNQQARLAVPNHFLKDWLVNYYQDILEREIAKATGHHPELEIVVQEADREDINPEIP